MSFVSKGSKKMNALHIISVLFFISVASAVVITLTFNLTSPIIAANEEERLLNTLQMLMPDAEEFEIITLEKDEESRDVYLGKKGDDILGIAMPATGTGFATFGDADVHILTLFYPDGTIGEVALQSHSQTPGIGDAIENPEFLSQFKHQDKESAMEKTALLEQIDLISGGNDFFGSRSRRCS